MTSLAKKCRILVILLATLIGGSVATAADSAAMPLATFESGNDGFAEGLTRDEKVAHSGAASGRIDGDFSQPNGTPWTIAGRDLSTKGELASVSFWVRSKEATGLTFRLEDASGQVHQQRPVFEPNGQWQQITLSSFDRGRGYQTWGGASDKKFHWPARQLSFLLEKNNLGGQLTGSAWIDDIEVTTVPGTDILPLAVEQAQLGNVFSRGEPVRIPVETQGTRVTWSVRDFWDNEVSSGESPVTTNKATIDPRVERLGYFEMQIEAFKGDTSIAKAMTSFAHIAPVDIRTMNDSSFGVMTHFAQGWDIDIMPLVAKAGIRLIRDEHYWQQTEPQTKGKYVFIDRFSNYLSRAAELGIDPILVMSFSNQLYDNDLTPHTPEGLNGFADYGVALLNRYGKQIKWLEVWNEYNGTWCSGPAKEDRGRYHALMCKYVYDKVKAVRPDVEVLGGAAVLLPPPYFESIFKNGGLASMDGVVIHPYRGRPEGIETEIDELRELMRKYDAGKEKPLWVTETGSIDTSVGGRAKIARYLTKQYTLLLTQNAKAICWYLLRDYNEFKSMGLLRDKGDAFGRYAPAPAYVAYANLIQQLYGATFVAREPVDQHTYVELFKKTDGLVRVCWANAPSHIALATTHPVTVVDLMGGEQTLTPVAGQVFVTLTEDPIYINSAADATLLPAGRFTLSPDQRTDLLEPVTLSFAYDNTGSNKPLDAEFQVLGKRYPFTVPANGKQDGQVVLTDEDTRAVSDRIYRYGLLIDSKPASVGGISFKTTDSLRLAQPMRMVDGETMELAIANASARTPYTVKRIGWTIGSADKGSHPADIKIPPGKTVVMRVRVAEVPAYTELPVALKLEFDERAALELNGSLSSNPIGKDNALSEMTLVSIDGKRKAAARATWNDEALLLSVKLTGEPIKIGIAPVDTDALDLRRGWYEFQIDPTAQTATVTLSPDDPSATGRIQVVAKDQGWIEVSIPWASVPGIDPKSGWIRLALAASRSRLQFGGGILTGRTPLEYRACRLLTGNESTDSAQDHAAPISVVSTSGIAGASTSDGDKLIANYDVDYSNVQGRAGWSYGYFDGSGDSAYTDANFKPLDFVQTMWGYEWSTPAVQHAKLTRTNAHPGVTDGRPVWTVQRWTSNVEGMVRVTGKAELNTTTDPSDGVGLKLLVDGVVYKSLLVGGAGRPRASTYDLVVPTKVGTKVDIGITPGPGLNSGWDVTSVTSQIYLTDLPTTK